MYYVTGGVEYMSVFYIFLLIGALFMFLCMWFASRFYEEIPVWKLLISAALLTAIGLLGAHIGDTYFHVHQRISQLKTDTGR